MLLGLQNVTFEFGARVIVRDATWHIQPGERIGLIGYNGTGKSTLLKVLTGQYHPSAGTVEKSRETTIGYLHQDLLSFDTEDSILGVALGAFEKVMRLEAEIAQLGKELEETSDEKLATIYADKLHELELAGGYEVHHKTEEVLQGLGFSNEDLQRPYAEFSGGWRMRVLLAKMILMSPDVLLLDEPTNHLDLPSIEWLEKYLQHYHGSVVIVSHDRYFLDRMVNKIVELYQQELHFYSGNYSYYLEEKALRIELQQRAYENQQDYIRQQERFVERFKAKASKAAQAQSIVKRLEKLERIESAELERPNMRINFSIDQNPGKVLCTLKHATKSFGRIKIVEDTSVEINRGDKIALIGANGKGKSTLLRMIAGTEPFEGERIPGHNVKQSFYAQHQLEALNLEHNVLEELSYSGSGKTDLELRTLLGCFLFSGDDVDKKIRILSGGEKARVALAKTIISKGNFLLLDEPTNHLDMHSVELLIEALQKYEGSYLLVSHDRYFVSKTANKIWEIQDLKVKEFAGGYEEWEQWKKDHQKPERKIEKAEPKERKEVARKSASQQQEKEKQRELQKIKKQFEQTEKALEKINAEKATLENLLASPDIYSDAGKFAETEKRYQELSRLSEKENQKYETLFEEIMRLEGEE
ncbi:MAG: ATP-binding cassette domain-containing protein [Chitinophagaceae bacterium]|nr:ATP-binding cassette domain-containing protein [Chitinophagaceae bacterium]MCZ2396247.1 ATP-binding cassette domain-containing protein [Chitinophagales bacterium]